MSGTCIGGPGTLRNTKNGVFAPLAQRLVGWAGFRLKNNRKTVFRVMEGRLAASDWWKVTKSWVIGHDHGLIRCQERGLDGPWLIFRIFSHFSRTGKSEKPRPRGEIKGEPKRSQRRSPGVMGTTVGSPPWGIHMVGMGPNGRAWAAWYELFDRLVVPKRSILVI